MDGGGYCIINNLYDLCLLKALLGYLNKAIRKYGIWAPGIIYVFV
jgi:hypothetical protein